MIFLLERINIERWLLCCLLFFLHSCTYRSSYKISSTNQNDSIIQEQRIKISIADIYNASKSVKEGDIILRTGKDFTSELMRLSSVTDKTYSHCGIASFEHDTLFVYHSLGGEWNPNQELRRDQFEFFCNPYESSGIGIFRYNLTKNDEVNLLKIVRDFYNRRVEFDMNFDLASDDKMYCTEFVYKSLEKATDYKLKIPLTIFNNKSFVAPDNLYVNSFCKPVLQLKFTRE